MLCRRLSAMSQSFAGHWHRHKAAACTDRSQSALPILRRPSCDRRFHLSAVATDTVETATEVTYETVIGIETHVQLKTQSKAFCKCANEYGAKPNTNVCPVCTGQPGALPVFNAEAARLGVLAGLALNCKIANVSKFDRKQYFYPDLPKGYQISQYDEPLCENGSLEITWKEEQKQGNKKKKVTKTKTIGITRAHLEEDAGKNMHSGGGGDSLVDLNRAGVPLLEIVTEPDFASGAEAAAYGAELRRIVRFLGISDGNMQEGSMRCDVNVSVRPAGATELGTKVEVKNMNSFGAMQKAIDFEVVRQSALMREGRAADIVQETRLFDEDTQETRTMRKKEGLADYRYFPEPDLLPLRISAADIDATRDAMLELPSALRARLTAAGLPEDATLQLAEDAATAAYYDAVVAAGANPVQAANWILRDIVAWCKENGAKIGEVKISPQTLAEVIALIEDGTISSKIAKELTPDLLEGVAEAGGVVSLVEERGMGQISDDEAILAMIEAAIADSPKQLEQYRAGKTKLQGFFQGQVMKASGGRVNPEKLARLLPARLAGEE
eukprot:jgi/Ulvmu1/9209/UM005_0309.1